MASMVGVDGEAEGGLPTLHLPHALQDLEACLSWHIAHDVQGILPVTSHLCCSPIPGQTLLEWKGVVMGLHAKECCQA